MTETAKQADAPARRAARPVASAPLLRNDTGSASTADLVALALALIWIIGVGAFLLFVGGGNDPGVDALRVLFSLLVLCLPPLIIWQLAAQSRLRRKLAGDVAALRSLILAMGSGVSEDTYGKPGQGHVDKRSVEARLDDLARAQKQTQTALSTFFSHRPDPKSAARDVSTKPADVTPETRQAMLALGTPPEALAEPLSLADFIGAMNFPKTPEDTDGFRALRRALKDRRTAEVIQSAEDVLTLLSQDGIYMDDLRPDRARPEIWRKFGDGDRGRAIAALGGIRDRSSLALSAARMKQDPVFRDAVHHFLRRFDQAFTEFAEKATDAEVAALAETRTARAFMLLGRVTGTFD